MGRAPCCEKVGLKRGKWTAEEDEILTKYIQANGEGSWRSLPKNAGLMRCGKSCRLRWINYLRSDLKRGNITAEEEDIMTKLHTSLGNRWSLIADHLPGRTDNEIKNYWNTHLSRKIQRFRKSTTTETLPQSALDLAKARKCSRTSPLAMKNNKSQNTSSNPKKLAENHKEDHDVIKMQSTPTLENEALFPWKKIKTGSTKLGPPWETEEGTINQVVPSPCQDPSGERENLILDHSEERENTRGMLCPDHEDMEYLDDVFDTCQGLDGAILCLGDIFGEGFLDDSDWVFTVGEERENNAMAISEERENGAKNSTNTGSGNRSSNNGESGEWFSSTCSSNTCVDLDYDLDWNVVVQGHDHDQLWVEEEKMLTWLWESDNVEEEGEKAQCEKQKAMVSWLLS